MVGGRGGGRHVLGAQVRDSVHLEPGGGWSGWGLGGGGGLEGGDECPKSLRHSKYGIFGRGKILRKDFKGKGLEFQVKTLKT